MAQHLIGLDENWQRLPARWRFDGIKQSGRLRLSFGNHESPLIYTNSRHATGRRITPMLMLELSRWLRATHWKCESRHPVPLPQEVGPMHKKAAL